VIRNEARELKHWFWKYKVKVYDFYHNPTVMYLVAAIILSNFVMECIQRQIDPFAEKYPSVWRVSEVFFSSVFLLELLINMYGSWWRVFFKIGWNYFDMLVVAIGILIMGRVQLPGPLSQILMLRAFRVFRLFGRIASLRKILLSIRKAIPGVMNAFIIMSLVVCIYAVLAVDLFKDAYDDPKLHNSSSAISMRGEVYGKEYYGTFLRALYTLFQILTGESWSEAGVRPLLWQPGLSSIEVFLIAIFFLSFIMINAIVLLNVVVAVLLDGMNSAGDQVDAELPQDKEEGEAVDVDDPTGEKVARRELAEVKAELAGMSTELNDLLAAIRKG